MEKSENLTKLQQAFEYLKDNGIVHTQQDIADKLGIQKSSMTKIFKGDPKRLTPGFLRRFAAAYKDYIREEWLLEGSGEMAQPDPSARPFLDVSLSAGFLDGISEGVFTAPLVTPGSLFPDYDFSMRVSGDSMAPDYQSGDILLCRRITDRWADLIEEILIFDTKEGAVLKQLLSLSPEEALLHSLNPAYPDYPLPLSSILGCARPVALIRLP